MARIRSIHPGIFTDEAFMQLSADAQVFLFGLWTEADDQGVFEWKPLTLKVRLRGGKDGAVEPLLEELEATNSIRSYEHGGRKFGAIRNFRRFQRPKKPIYVHQVPDELEDFVGPNEGEDGIRKRKWEEQDGKCFYCETEISYYSKRYISLEIDHKLPVSRGGTDDDDNLCATCRNCNRAKCDMSDVEFREWRKSHPKNEFRNPKEEHSPQMEDGGGRREDGISSLRSDRRAPQADALPKRKAKRGLPEGFPGETDRKWAATMWLQRARADLCDRMEEEIQAFRDHHTQHGKTMADWPAAWRTWGRNALKFSRAPTRGPGLPEAKILKVVG